MLEEIGWRPISLVAAGATQQPRPFSPVQCSVLGHEACVRRLTAELMLEEIGRRPTSSDAASATQQPGPGPGHENREGYAWAAAMGLGLITLGKGRAAAGLADMRIEQRLR